MSSSNRNVGPASNKRPSHKFFIKTLLKHASNDDDEWAKGKPISIGKVHLDNNTSSKVQFYPLSVSARAEDLSRKAEKTSVLKVQL